MKKKNEKQATAKATPDDLILRLLYDFNKRLMTFTIALKNSH